MRFFVFCAMFITSLCCFSFASLAEEKPIRIRPDQILSLVQALSFIPPETQQALLKDGMEVLAAYNRLPSGEQQRIRLEIDRILQDINRQNGR